MSSPERPGRILPLLIAAEVAVAVDEVARRVAVFFQRTQHVVVRRDPVGSGDQPLETEASQIPDRVVVELPLGFHQECRRVLVARSFFRKNFYKRAEPEAAFGEIIPRVRHAVPCRKGFVQRTVLFDGPVAEELLQLAHLGVGHMVVVERPEKERVLVDQLHAHERRVVHQGLSRRPFAGEDFLPPAPIKLLEFRLEIEQRERRRFASVTLPPPRAILRRHPEREVNREVRVNPLGFRGLDDLLLVLDQIRVDRAGFPVIKAPVHADHVDPVLGECLEGCLQSIPLEFIGRAVDCPEPHRLVVLPVDEFFAADLDEAVFTREFLIEKAEVDGARLEVVSGRVPRCPSLVGRGDLLHLRGDLVGFERSHGGERFTRKNKAVDRPVMIVRAVHDEPQRVCPRSERELAHHRPGEKPEVRGVVCRDVHGRGLAVREVHRGERGAVERILHGGLRGVGAQPERVCAGGRDGERILGFAFFRFIEVRQKIAPGKLRLFHLAVIPGVLPDVRLDGVLALHPYPGGGKPRSH